jgi:starch phosphorylase
MRRFIDEENLPWDLAWDITQATCAYKPHHPAGSTEKWSVLLFETVLPRHLQIIYEINRGFWVLASGFRGDPQTLSVEEEPVKAIRMANLAIVGSHSVKWRL